jgi:ribose 5-phosphate isomerase B
MAITANKFPGVRAALVHDVGGARSAREHNDANVLVLGGRVVPQDLAREILRVFLETPFAGGRHQRRVDRITAIERELGLHRPEGALR